MATIGALWAPHCGAFAVPHGPWRGGRTERERRRAPGARAQPFCVPPYPPRGVESYNASVLAAKTALLGETSGDWLKKAGGLWLIIALLVYTQRKTRAPARAR
jgi:hypothetical protein